MNNDFWIFCKTKTCRSLVIDVYDPAYIERSREDRFSELKALLTHDIMSVKRVYMRHLYSTARLKLKDSWIAIERIVEIHKMLEKNYSHITPLATDGEPGTESWELDERFDNTYLPHYRLARKKGKSQRGKTVEGEQYLKSDGEVYTVVHGTETRVCELVWEAWKGEIPEGSHVSHIDGNKQNNRLDNLELVKQQ